MYRIEHRVRPTYAVYTEQRQIANKWNKILTFSEWSVSRCNRVTGFGSSFFVVHVWLDYFYARGTRRSGSCVLIPKTNRGLHTRNTRVECAVDTSTNLSHSLMQRAKRCLFSFSKPMAAVPRRNFYCWCCFRGEKKMNSIEQRVGELDVMGWINYIIILVNEQQRRQSPCDFVLFTQNVYSLH